MLISHPQGKSLKTLIQHRTGRIGIHEGDEPRQLAKNFCRAFGIKSQDMFTKLLAHLQASISNYQIRMRQRADKFKLPDSSQLDYNLNSDDKEQAELRLDNLPNEYSLPNVYT